MATPKKGKNGPVVSVPVASVAQAAPPSFASLPAPPEQAGPPAAPPVAPPAAPKAPAKKAPPKPQAKAALSSPPPVQNFSLAGVPVAPGPLNQVNSGRPTITIRTGSLSADLIIE